MAEIERIRDQFRRSMEGDAWHGPAVFEVLASVTPEMAGAKPLGSAHSIWEIVLHITAWQRAAVRMLLGEAVHLSDQEDWPPVNGGSEAWKNAVEELRDTQATLDRAISQLDDSRLGDPVIAREYNVYVLLHGVIQHGLYHAGQIAILKKGLTPGPLPQ